MSEEWEEDIDDLEENLQNEKAEENLDAPQNIIETPVVETKKVEFEKSDQPVSSQNQQSNFIPSSNTNGPQKFGGSFHGGSTTDNINIQQRLGQNKIMLNSLRPKLGQNEDTENSEVPQESAKEKLENKIAGTAVSATTGIPAPLAQEGVKIARQFQKKINFAGKILEMFGFSKKITNDPIKSKICLYAIMGIFVSLILLVIISSFQGRTESRREAIINYLESGEVEGENETDNNILQNIGNNFLNTSLYTYLREEGFCDGIDCYFSDAAKFYRMFRQQITGTELKYFVTNWDSACTDAGFSSTQKLDIPMLTSTFTYNRNDEEFLSHKEDEVYSEKLSKYKKEINDLTNAMIAVEDEVIRSVNVKGIEDPVKVMNESTCTEYGMTWKKNNYNRYGGYCIKTENNVLPDNVTINKTAKKCAIVSEENYKNYVIGDGKYYLTPGTYEPGSSTEELPPSNSNQHTNDYINLIGDWASKDMSKYGIYASVTIAQGILESNWGKSGLTTKFNNHFGMKIPAKDGHACSREIAGTTAKKSKGNEAWDGTAACMCGSDGCYWYRAYKNVGESLADHSRNFWVTKSYGRNGVLDCLQNNLGAEEQIKRIKKAGYASDPNYVSKIVNLINKYGLKKYDTGSYNGSNPNLGNNTSPPSSNNAPNTYTSGGYLELYRMELLEDSLDLNVEKQSVYNDILDEAKEFGSAFGTDKDMYDGIFNSTVGGDYTNWKQGDPAWKYVLVGNSKENIGKIGCAATSVAIQIARSGTKVNIDNFNPGTFVQAMSNSRGFDSGGNIIWGNVTSVAPFFQFTYGKMNMIGLSRREKLQKMSDLINEGCYLIMSVKGYGHWVAVTGISNNNVEILDPGANSGKYAWPHYSEANSKGLRCYKKVD